MKEKLSHEWKVVTMKGSIWVTSNEWKELNEEMNGKKPLLKRIGQAMCTNILT